MRPLPASHLRIARPSRDLRAAERFWVGGLGTPVPSRNPYWDDGGITIADPDGYRLVLTSRRWA